MFASRTRSLLTCMIRGLGCAAFAAAKMVSASFNAGPVFSYITAVLMHSFKFSIANFHPAANVDVNMRSSVTFIFLLEFLKPHLTTAASRTVTTLRLIGACPPSFLFVTVRPYADHPFSVSAASLIRGWESFLVHVLDPRRLSRTPALITPVP